MSSGSALLSLTANLSLSLNVPILDGADDVAFIHRSQHDFDFVTSVALEVRHQKVDASARRLNALALNDLQIAETEKRRVVQDLLLQPCFIETQRPEALRANFLEL